MFNRKTIKIALLVLVVALASVIGFNKFVKHYDVVTEHGVKVCVVTKNFEGGKSAFRNLGHSLNFEKKSTGCDLIKLRFHPMNMKTGTMWTKMSVDYACPYRSSWSRARMNKCEKLEEALPRPKN